MATLYLHRLNLVEREGIFKLEKVPENKEQHNFGVRYRLSISLIDENHAKVHGWDTGYPTGCDGGVKGTIYAPKGLKKRELVFVDVNDELLSVSKEDNSSLDKFLANLEKSEALLEIDKLQGFSFIGEIIYDIERF